MIFVRILLGFILFSGVLHAHQVESVELEFSDLGAAWQLEGEVDIAYMLPETREVPGGLPMSRAAVMKSSPEEFARIRRETETRLRQLIRLTFHDRELPWTMEFPDFQSSPVILPEDAADVAYLTCRIVADAQPDAGRLRAFWAGEQETELIILIQNGDESRIISALPGGSALLLEKQGADPGRAGIASRSGGWVRSGFHHVLGADHVLFILGLFLLAPGWGALGKQSLLFTLAHSLSLAAAACGWVDLPGKWVEHLIALSIAWIGIENLVTRKLGRQRLLLVFCFGLLHGLGFASVLAEKLRGLSGRQLAAPLFGFNVGVELAQVAILATAFVLLWPVRDYTATIRKVGSVCIAAVGIVWVVQRWAFPGSPLF